MALYKSRETKQMKRVKNPKLKVSPAGKASADPYADIATGLSYIVISGLCHLWAKNTLTQIIFIVMCFVAAYMIVRGVSTLIKEYKSRKQ